MKTPQEEMKKIREICKGRAAEELASRGDWNKFHSKSELWAKMAEDQYDILRQKEYYLKAATAEENALNALSKTKIRTVGITAVSVVALYVKAGKSKAAEKKAQNYLENIELPKFAFDQIESMRQKLENNRIKGNKI